MKPALLERFGSDFVGLLDDIGLRRAAHLRELLGASPDEQDQLVMAWMKAAATLEAEWAARSRRPSPDGHVSLARYMEIRLPSPRAALAAQQTPQQSPLASASAVAPPTPRERESAQRRIRLEGAIAEARTALLRIGALDQLVEVDRAAVVAELEEVQALISRRLRIGG